MVLQIDNTASHCFFVIFFYELRVPKTSNKDTATIQQATCNQQQATATWQHTASRGGFGIFSYRVKNIEQK